MSDEPLPPDTETPEPEPQELQPSNPPATLQPERYPFWSYSDFLVFLVLAAACMLLSLGVVKVGTWALGVRAPNRAAELVAGQFIGYAMLLGLLILIVRVQYHRPFWRSLGWTDPRFPFLAIVLAGMAMAMAVAMIAHLIKTPTTTNPMMELMKDRTSVILLAVFGVTIGPLFEELIFRGFLQPLLVRSLGITPGVLAASLPFGLLHFQQYGNSWRHVLVIAVAGASFGAMRQATGSTKASTIMHASYNGLFFVALLVQGQDLS